MTIACIHVGVAIILGGGRYLITRRRGTAPLGGLWEFPGGKCEKGETHEECLRRELKEELSIDVAVHEKVETISYAYPGYTVLLHCYRCSIIGGTLAPSGCDEFRWVSPQEIRQYPFPPADEPLLKIIAEGERWGGVHKE